MATSETTRPMHGLQSDLAQTVRRYLANRWLLIGAALIALVAGAAVLFAEGATRDRA
jgi:hypothetical protein